MLGLMGGIYTALAATYNIIYGISGTILIGIVFVAIIFSQTIPNFMCRTCKAKRFTPDYKVKLRKFKKDHDEHNDDSSYESEQYDISKKLDEFSHDQKKHHTRDLILRIVGIGIAAIIGIVGLIYAGEPFDFLTEVWK